MATTTDAPESTESAEEFNPWKVAFNTKRWRLGVLLVSFALIFITPLWGLSPNEAEMVFFGVLVAYGAWQLDMKNIEFATEDNSDTSEE